MTWKIVRYSLLVIMMAAAVMVLYAWLNTATSLDYARQQQKTEHQRSELLRQFLLTLNPGAKRADIAEVVSKRFREGHVIKEEQDRIVVDDVVFQFDRSQTLSKVQFLGAEGQ
jgi:hypothetical protein